MAKKQNDLPGVQGAGVGGVQIPEVDAAAAEYVKWRDKRMDLTKKEVDSKKKLIDILHVHEKAIGKDGDGIIRYVYDDSEVILAPTGEQLKVKAYVDPGAPE